VLETFSFDESTETGIVYPDIVDEFFMLILEEGGPEDILFHKEMKGFLYHKFPEKWNRRVQPITWPPHSPDITHLDFFQSTSRMQYT
jgi:hypothetical protein